MKLFHILLLWFFTYCIYFCKLPVNTFQLKATEYYIYKDDSLATTIVSPIFKSHKTFIVNKDTLKFKESIWGSDYYQSQFAEFEFKNDTLLTVNYALNDSLRIEWSTSK